jgi:hypothetical protein
VPTVLVSRRTSDVGRAGRIGRVGRVTAAGLTALALSTLTACSGPGPGVAAEVDGTTITTEQVDDFALLLCSLGGVPGGEGAATKSARQQALTLLIGNVAAFELVDEDSLDPAAVEQAVAQNEQARAGVPESQVAVFDAFVEDFSRAQIGLVEVGTDALAEQGQDPSAITQEAAFAEGQRLRQEVLTDADIELDPRFGSVTDGVVGPRSEQLSVPVSDLAVEGSSSEPSETLGGLLPASQTCS